MMKNKLARLFFQTQEIEENLLGSLLMSHAAALLEPENKKIGVLLFIMVGTHDKAFSQNLGTITNSLIKVY